MAVLSWPAGLRNPNQVHLALKANTQSGGVSPFDMTEQTLELPGAHWVAELRWTNLPESQWRIFQAFIANLGGRAGRFTWGPAGFMPRKGAATGSPWVSGSLNSGKTLTTDGWSAGTAFKAGDVFSITDPAGRNVLHMVTADVVTAGGVTSIPIAPALRRVPANGVLLNLTNPQAVWRLTSDDAGVDYGRGVFADVALQIEEAVF